MENGRSNMRYDQCETKRKGSEDRIKWELKGGRSRTRKTSEDISKLSYDYNLNLHQDT